MQESLIVASPRDIRALIFARRSAEIALRFPTDEEVRDAAPSVISPD
jgi:hypothetical protein